jgi:hypothetical protein
MMNKEWRNDDFAILYFRLLRADWFIQCWLKALNQPTEYDNEFEALQKCQ